MTHLGLNSAAAAAERGFDVICFDPDETLVGAFSKGALPIVELGLPEALARNEKRVSFTSSAAELNRCNIVYVAPDVATGDDGTSDLSELEALLDTVVPHVGDGATEVILSQVPPGFTRGLAREGRALYYQVETLIFGNAFERALNPERFIVGCANPEEALPAAYQAYLDAFDCLVLPMRYESAELAKIAINCCLVSQLSVANTLAELCEKIGADWREIVPALQSDKRIGPHSYLKPGLGIAGGNLERDLATVVRLAEAKGTDAGVVQAWIGSSAYCKLATARVLEEHVLPGLTDDPVVAVWGLAYKENTHSTKNSPALATLLALPDVTFRVHDPVVDAEAVVPGNVTVMSDPMAALVFADALLIMTPWPFYREINPVDVVKAMRGRAVIDPYGTLDVDAVVAAGLDYHTLGAAPVLADSKD